MLEVLYSLNAWSSSKIESDPVEASSCPTGRDVTPISDKVFVTEKSITLSEISTTNLGDISIRSKVESNLFITSTTILIPCMYANSLYTTDPFTLFINCSGDVRSFTKFVLFVIASEPRFQLYSGVKESYPLSMPVPVYI